MNENGDPAPPYVATGEAIGGYLGAIHGWFLAAGCYDPRARARV